MRFGKKSEGLKGQKLTKLNVSKNFPLEKIPFKKVFAKHLSHWFVFFILKIVYDSVLHDSAKIPCLRKIWFFSYGLKCSQPTWLQYSLSSISLEGINPSLTFFVWRWSSREDRMWDCLFWLGVARCAFRIIRLQDSLMSMRRLRGVLSPQSVIQGYVPESVEYFCHMNSWNRLNEFKQCQFSLITGRFLPNN